MTKNKHPNWSPWIGGRRNFWAKQKLTTTTTRMSYFSFEYYTNPFGIL